MEETISLQEIFNILRKHIILIVSSMFVFLGIAAILTFFVIQPKYSGESQLIVKMPKTENVNTADVNATLMMINTYKDIIKSSVVIDESKKELKKNGDFIGTSQELQEKLTISQEQNSQMFTIKATADSPEEAKNIANTVSKVFQKQAKEIVDVDKISIIAPANLNTKPISPDKKLNLALGAILGTFIGIAIAVSIQLFDKTVKDDKFVRETLGIPILGTVPQMNEKEIEQSMSFKDTSNVSRTVTNSRRSRN